MLDAQGNPAYRPHPVLARSLDILLTLHAEHEMNCSTAAVRHLASSGVDVYTAIAGTLQLVICMPYLSIWSVALPSNIQGSEQLSRFDKSIACLLRAVHRIIGRHHNTGEH